MKKHDMDKNFTIKVQGVPLVTFDNYEDWDAAQDEMKCTRKDFGISWGCSIDCVKHIIDYAEPCVLDKVIIDYYLYWQGVKNRMKSA